jgi:hypothetical protein
VRRSGPDGQVLLDVVVNITQRIPGYFDRTLRQCLRNPEPGEIADFWFRGGCTLIVDVDAGRIRYCIFKRLDSERRFEQQKEFLGGRETSPSLAGTYFEAAGYRQPEEIFALLHQHYYQPELP